uniref:Glycoprotein n=1 Tax=North Fork virus TaxID=3139876 RepID=A0AAN0N8C9_9VIRU
MFSSLVILAAATLGHLCEGGDLHPKESLALQKAIEHWSSAAGEPPLTTQPTETAATGLAHGASSTVTSPQTRGALYSDEHGLWIPVFPTPPPACRPPSHHKEEVTVAVVTVWGPSEKEHSKRVRLYQKWFTRSACTVYFWGSKWARTLEDTITTMDAEEPSSAVFSSFQREVWGESEKPDVSCRWTGEMISEGSYFKRLLTTAKLSISGNITFPQGFSQCSTASPSPCLSDDGTTLLVVENPSPVPTLCDSIEAKLVAPGQRAQGDAHDIVTIPSHHLEFSLDDYEVRFSCGGGDRYELYLTRSGYILSMHDNTSTPSAPLRLQMTKFWNKTSVDKAPSFSVDEAGWLIVSKIPLRPDYSAAELFHGLQALQDQSAHLFQTIHHINCRRHEEAWSLASAIAPLNPTPLAQLAARNPQVVGAIHQGTLFAILPQEVNNISFSLPLEGAGDWAKVTYRTKDGKSHQGWMESFTGRVRPARPTDHELQTLSAFWVPLTSGDFWNPVSHQHLIPKPEEDEGQDWREIPLATVSLGAIYSPSSGLPSAAYVGAAASVHFIMAHMSGHGVLRVQGADMSTSANALTGFLSSAFGWWDIIKWALVSAILLIIVSISLVCMSKILKHVSCSRSHAPRSRTPSIEHLQGMMKSN